MRAVFDPNVLIAALLSPAGTPAQLASRWLAGDFELVVSDQLLAELSRALAYPKIRDRIAPDAAQEFIDLLRRSCQLGHDDRAPQPRSADPGDDYLIALAEAASALLVSGDTHLLDLADQLPIYSPRQFIGLLDT